MLLNMTCLFKYKTTKGLIKIGGDTFSEISPLILKGNTGNTQQVRHIQREMDLAIHVNYF